MGACRHGQEGHLPPSPSEKKCFVHCKTLSRRIIYALFSQTVVGFWRLRSQIPTGAPSLGPRFRPQTPNLLTPGKNPADTHAHYYKPQKSNAQETESDELVGTAHVVVAVRALHSLV